MLLVHWILNEQIVDLTEAVLKLKQDKGDRITIKNMEKAKERMERVPLPLIIEAIKKIAPYFEPELHDIAERLVVSVRTVHNHVAHVFDKLGISRRSDLGPLFEPGDESIPER